MTRRINAAGLAIVKHYEDCELESYLCPSRVWTIGYGHTHNVQKGMVWTQRQCDETLEADLREFEAAVERLVTVPLTENQFSAIVSWVFNVGVGAMEGSTLLRKLNKADYAGASAEFQRWDRSGAKILRGLTRRRIAERDLFDKVDKA